MGSEKQRRGSRKMIYYNQNKLKSILQYLTDIKPYVADSEKEEFEKRMKLYNRWLAGEAKKSESALKEFIEFACKYLEQYGEMEEGKFNTEQLSIKALRENYLCEMIAAAFYLLSVSTGNMKKERDREKDKALATISEKIRETLQEAAEEEWSVYYICEEEDVYKIYFPYLQYICNSYEETSRRLSAYELEAYVSGEYEAGTEEWKTEVCEYIEDGGLLHDELSEAGMTGEELIEKEEELTERLYESEWIPYEDTGMFEKGFFSVNSEEDFILFRIILTSVVKDFFRKIYDIKEEKFLRERVEAEVKEEGEESHYKKHDTVFINKECMKNRLREYSAEGLKKLGKQVGTSRSNLYQSRNDGMMKMRVAENLEQVFKTSLEDPEWTERFERNLDEFSEIERFAEESKLSEHAYRQAEKHLKKLLAETYKINQDIAGKSELEKFEVSDDFFEEVVYMLAEQWDEVMNQTMREYCVEKSKN